jgi:hypothetical protein
MTQPVALDYHSPGSTPTPRRPFWRFVLLGPVTGSAVGFVQTSAAVVCWLAHGAPDFFFRGWSGVDMHYVLLIIGGGIVGIPYGICLWLFERLSLRRVRLFIAVPLLLVVALLIEGGIVWIEFERRKLLDVRLLPQMAAVLIGLGISSLTSEQA